MLRRGDWYQKVSNIFCSKEPRSLTLWGKEMATKGLVGGFAARKRPDHLLSESREWPPASAAGFAAKRPDHLHTESRKWSPKGQQHVLQQRDQITYCLRAGDGHQWVSSSVATRRQDHLHPEGRRWPPKGSAGSFAARRPNHLLPAGRRWLPKGQWRICNVGMVRIQYVYQK